MLKKPDRDENLSKTNVEIMSHVYDNFKNFNKIKKYPIPKLLNRCMDLYVKNEEFRKTVNSHTDLMIFNIKM
jgi:hypothetical protein